MNYQKNMQNLLQHPESEKMWQGGTTSGVKNMGRYICFINFNHTAILWGKGNDGNGNVG